jgi:hypothetical protein
MPSELERLQVPRLGAQVDPLASRILPVVFSELSPKATR